MKIRRAVPEDFFQLAALDREVWEDFEFIPDGEHVWRLWTEHGIVSCAEVDSGIVGAVLAFPCANGSYCVHKVFVEESFRGEGLGSRLFELLLKDLDKQNLASFLTVDPANEAAVALYEKWGFTERKFVKGYYRPEEDRYILSRPAANFE